LPGRARTTTSDEWSRVLDASGAPIPGLYATGNASASVMGNEYAGAGATIGPAVAFGWIAANHAVRSRPVEADHCVRRSS
jgi:3-oxosteroid 1-dehydrogenase